MLNAEAETLLWLPDMKNQLIGKGPDAGKGWRQEEKEQQRMKWLDGITDWLNGHEFKQIPGDSEGREAWHAVVHGVTRVGHNLGTEQQYGI